MVRTGSAILIFLIVLKDKEVSRGGNLQPYMAGYFYLYFKVLRRYYLGTIIRAGVTCKKISCYMRDSACRWFISKKAKIYCYVSYVKYF